jgi:hypothetical protein
MALIRRRDKDHNSPLTFEELDGNFDHLETELNDKASFLLDQINSQSIANLKLGSDITVKGEGVGMYTDNTVVSSDTTLLQVITNMLTTVVPASYQAPTLSLRLDGATTYEVGQEFAANINALYQKRDAGEFNRVHFIENGSEIHSSADSGDLSYVHGGQVYYEPTALSYTTRISYEQGLQKYDNLGNASGTPIPAGEIQSTAKSINVRYKTRYQKNGAQLTDSDEVRAISNDVWDNVNTINIPIEVGDTSFDLVLPPKKIIDEIWFEGTLRVEQTDDFELIGSIPVKSYDGTNEIDYSYYRYQPTASFPSSANFNITLKNEQ